MTLDATIDLWQARARNAPPHLMALGVWFAVSLHVWWAILLFASKAPQRITGVYALSRLFPARTGLAIILLIVAGCALLSLTGPHVQPVARVALLVPQQLVLGISAAGAVRTAAVGHFADGVARPIAFLLADQGYQVIALAVHSLTILYLALVAEWR